MSAGLPRTTFVETNNHLGVGGFFQVCAVGNEFVAVLDVSVLATGEGSVTPTLG